MKRQNSLVTKIINSEYIGIDDYHNSMAVLSFLKRVGLITDKSISTFLKEEISFSIFKYKSFEKRITKFSFRLLVLSIILLILLMQLELDFFTNNSNARSFIISLYPDDALIEFINLTLSARVPPSNWFYELNSNRIFIVIFYVIILLYLVFSMYRVSQQSKKRRIQNKFVFQKISNYIYREYFILLGISFLSIFLFAFQIALATFIYGKPGSNLQGSLELILITPISLVIFILYLGTSLLFFFIPNIVAQYAYPEGCFYYRIIRLINRISIGYLGEKRIQRLELSDLMMCIDYTTRTRKGRKKLLYEIDKLIVPFKKSFSLKTTDPIESMINKKTRDKAVTHLKNIKMWIYTPMPDTDYYLIKELSIILETIASGNLHEYSDLIPDLDQDMKTKNKIYFYSKKYILLLIKVLLPFSGILIIDKLGIFGLNEDLYSALMIGSFVLAIVTIFSELDPKVGEQVKFMQEIILNHFSNK